MQIPPAFLVSLSQKITEIRKNQSNLSCFHYNWSFNYPGIIYVPTPIKKTFSQLLTSLRSPFSFVWRWSIWFLIGLPIPPRNLYVVWRRTSTTFQPISNWCWMLHSPPRISLEKLKRTYLLKSIKQKPIRINYLSATTL